MKRGQTGATSTTLIIAIVASIIIGSVGTYTFAPRTVEKIVEVPIDVPYNVTVEVPVPYPVETIVTEFASLAELAEAIRSGEIDVGDDYTMSFMGRYHTIHTRELGIDCSACHTADEYEEAYIYQRKFEVPVGGAPGVVDRETCYGCHKENSVAQELYSSPDS